MVYITADGTVHQGERPRSPYSFSRLEPKSKAAVIAVIALVLWHWFNWNNPLANGKIPAADSDSRQHWNIIKSDDLFSRRMTEHLTAFGGNKRNPKMEEEMNPDMPIEVVLGHVDFGGANGHRHEALHADDDLENVQGTRCSSTRSAITAYFCGANVAMNQDVALERQEQKPNYHGVRSFSQYIKCRHQQGKENGGRNHRRAVYRLGVGCRDMLAGYSHAFSIVAQPDGSFFWLQSYISQYSLQTWMNKVDKLDGTPSGHLTLDQLLEKLQKLERLMNIQSWTPQANSDYYELFNVDKEKESLKPGKPPVSATWKPTHRLSAFVWDEACEYPLPSSPPTTIEEEDTNRSDRNPPASTEHDECNLVLGGNDLLDALTEMLKNEMPVESAESVQST